MRCIRIFMIHDSYASEQWGYPVFNRAQCSHHTFGTHDFCKSCLRGKVWETQSGVCAIRACEARMPTEADGRLLYPQHSYSKGVYDRMHVVCLRCFQRYVRTARHSHYSPRMDWIDADLVRELEEAEADWCRANGAGKWEALQFRKTLYKRYRPVRAKRDPELGRCADCHCEAPVASLKYGDLRLCWVCKENRLWALGLHPGIRKVSPARLYSTLKSFAQRIDEYRKYVPVSHLEECDLLDVIAFLTVRTGYQHGNTSEYQRERRLRLKQLVSGYWYCGKCPSCGSPTEDSKWVINWAKDLASCRTCYSNGWAISFRDALIPFGL